MFNQKIEATFAEGLKLQMIKMDPETYHIRDQQDQIIGSIVNDFNMLKAEGNVIIEKNGKLIPNTIKHNGVASFVPGERQRILEEALTLFVKHE